MSLKGQIRPIKFNPLLTNEEVLAEMGRRLAAARIRLRLTQAELAAKAGISERTCRRLEKGAGLGSLTVKDHAGEPNQLLIPSGRTPPLGDHSLCRGWAGRR